MQSELYSALEKPINTIDSPGIPQCQIADEQTIGLLRKDMTGIKPQELMRSLVREGELMGGVDTIPISDKKQILVFNTGVPSAHTVFRVPYQTFADTWREKALEAGLEVLDNTVFIAGNGSNDKVIVPPTYVPLDLLVWTIIEEETDEYDPQGQRIKRYLPVDIGDLCSPDSNNELIDQYKLHLPMDKLTTIFSTVNKRGKAATETLLHLYNNVIRPAYGTNKNNPLWLPTITHRDIMQGVANGFHRGDVYKMLDQFFYDQLGLGPQSFPSLHFRYTCHLLIETINKLNLKMRGKSSNDIYTILASNTDYFGEGIDFGKLQPDPDELDYLETKDVKIPPGLFDIIPPEDILKLIDPYATITHDVLEKWLEQKFIENPYYAEDIHEGTITVSAFAHHTTEYEQNLHVSEGAEITIKCEKGQEDAVMAQAMTQVSLFVGEIFYPMWDDIKRFVKHKIVYTKQECEEELAYLQLHYDLPPDAIELINKIRPTEKQLRNIAITDLSNEQRERVNKELEKYQRYKERLIPKIELLKNEINEGKRTKKDLIHLIYLMQIGQLFDDPRLNHGYNIPGVPSFGIHYYFDEEKKEFHMLMQWLMSTKGLAELWLGALLKRKKKDAESLQG